MPQTKIIIIGADKKWEEEQLLTEAQKFTEAKFFLLENLHISLNENKVTIHHQDNDQNEDITEELKSSKIIFRRSRGHHTKMVTLSLIAEHLKIPHTDSSESIMTNLDKFANLPTIKTTHIQHIPTIFTTQSKLDPIRYSLFVNPFPLLVKPSCGRHGEGITICENQEELTQAIQSCEDTAMIQPFLEITAEFRVFAVGKNSLGVIKKIPAEGSKVANYAAGAKFIPTELPPEIEKEAIQICQEEKIDIGGVDIAQANSKYYLLEINRCPEFKAFTQATKVNVAQEIIQFTNSL